MARSNMRERTVQFFEVVETKSGEHVRTSQRNWESILSSLALEKTVDLTLETNQTLVGTVHPYEGVDYLLLHKVKAPGEWLSIMNMATGEWRELEFQASEGYLDTTVIAFLPYGNIIGLMQGSPSAPSHRALEGWMNGLEIFSKPIIIRPLVSRAEVEKLATASGAAKIEIRIGAHKIEQLRQKNGRLASFLRTASEDYGDVRVTVTISVPRGGARAEDRIRLLRDLKDLDDVVPGAADIARARLIYTDSNGDEYSKLIELVEHHITAKRRVPAVDDRGNSVRILSAVRIILGVAEEHEEDLRSAADAQD